MLPSVYFFDMDHTLANNDCDVSWKHFLVAGGLAPAAALDEAERFFDDYRRGQLDVPRFMAFQLREFGRRTEAEMREIAAAHFQAVVAPLIYDAGRREVERALKSGRPVALLTATNRIIAEPVAKALGIGHLLATELAMVDGRFTGEIVPPYCGGGGKIAIGRAFCRRNGLDFAAASYYGDSPADIPMLAAVAFPVVCNPAAELECVAAENLWPVKFWGVEQTPAG